MRRRIINHKSNFIALFLCSTSLAVMADVRHYNNILIGDRAAGLAGAYVAISDDPSGLYYNPAGIVHATTKNISGSMNAIHTTETIYKNAIGNNTDWVRSSNELLPNFFGMLQDFNGGKFGFSYAVVDAVLENQDQDFNNIGSSINNFAINFNNQDKTIYFGPSFAMALNKKFSLGVTVYGHSRQKEQILHQYIDIDVSNGNFAELTDYNSISETGIRPIIGLMYSPVERVSFGMTIAKTTILSTTNRTQNTETIVTNNVVIKNGRTDNSDDIKRKLPLTVSAGLALFVNNSLLVSGDLTYQEAIDDRISVINFAIASEYYVSPTMALRGGVFSNFSNAPELSASRPADSAAQAEHIDYYGIALSTSWFTANNTLSVGINWSKGKGEAQLFQTTSGGVAQLQSVVSTTLTMFLSATYSY